MLLYWILLKQLELAFSENIKSPKYKDDNLIIASKNNQHTIDDEEAFN